MTVEKQDFIWIVWGYMFNSDKWVNGIYSSEELANEHKPRDFSEASYEIERFEVNE